MSIEVALRTQLLGLVPELAARVREELGRPRLVLLKSAPVAYRAILEGEKRGEIAVYRIGHSSFVDEAELFAWIRRVGAKREEPAQQPADDIGALIEMGDQRRRRRSA